MNIKHSENTMTLKFLLHYDDMLSEILNLTNTRYSDMKVLMYRYGSICEPFIKTSFEAMKLDVVEIKIHEEAKPKTDSERVQALSDILMADSFLFVFSINFFPIVSDTCNIINVPYVCWTVDSPVIELFSPSIANTCNRIFLFDHDQYDYFKYDNPGHIFYLPLATEVFHFDHVLKNASSADRQRFHSDVSFVGSLYSEMNPYSKVKGLSDHTKGFIDALVNAQIKIHGINIMPDSITNEVLDDCIKNMPELSASLCKDNPRAQRYLLAHYFMGSECAQRERYLYLKCASENFNTDLYTFSDTSRLPKIHNKGGANTLREMPIIFNESKINLNITMRPISSGLSLRIFDVCGCGGFLLTNYQNELPLYYEIGKEVETFTSEEEFIDKIQFYLTHEKERRTIAENALKRTAQEHTYIHRISKLIKTLLES